MHLEILCLEVFKSRVPLSYNLLDGSFVWFMVNFGFVLWAIWWTWWSGGLRIVPYLRIWLHYLFRDFHSIPATQYSLDPGQLLEFSNALNEELIFTSRSPGTAIPPGTKLLEMRHKPIYKLEDIHHMFLSDMRLWGGSGCVIQNFLNANLSRTLWECYRNIVSGFVSCLLFEPCGQSKSGRIQLLPTPVLMVIWPRLVVFSRWPINLFTGFQSNFWRQIFRKKQCQLIRTCSVTLLIMKHWRRLQLWCCLLNIFHQADIQFPFTLFQTTLEQKLDSMLCFLHNCPNAYACAS